MQLLEKFFLKSITFKQHLIIGFLIRFLLIIYSEIHDSTSELPYTDIDYRVITDSSKFVLDGKSPFKRHTFRYSPLISYLLIPNIILHKSFGKFLFSICDIIVTVLIQSIVYHELKSIFYEQIKRALLNRQQRLVQQQKQQEERKEFDDSEIIKKLNQIQLPLKFINLSRISAFLWLYNPLSMVISTRGNGDSFSSIFVLSTLYFLHKFNRNNFDIFKSGLLHGVSIHLRLYPIIFSLSYFLCLSTTLNSNSSPALSFLTSFKNLFRKIFQPNLQQILFIFGTILSLFSLTGLFYYLYNWEFIYESILYHLIRKDQRHNFSLYFLMQYLGDSIDYSFIEKCLIQLPKFIILLYLNLTFGQHLKTLSFCIFCQIFILVTYNTVVTSQYFIWYLTLLPLCIKNLQMNLSRNLAITYFCLWLLGQGLWLLPAYLLEYKCWNTFNFIGIQSICFFFINIFILQRFIYYFDLIQSANIIKIK